MEPPKLGKRQWFCTKCGRVGRCANADDFAVVLERAEGGDPRACVCAQKTACEKRRLAKLAVEPGGFANADSGAAASELPADRRSRSARPPSRGLLRAVC